MKRAAFVKLAQVHIQYVNISQYIDIVHTGINWTHITICLTVLSHQMEYGFRHYSEHFIVSAVYCV